ncbi:site-specific DNA-methyltransferase [Paraglaciecola chathamensis]|uniref:site-specific DNA-methyltransferase (adenine-specific) n=1 Tax=Paraglaciecola chathamensis TaxID=368405 RepID=A0ABS0WHF5_9ALTE|nr:site-specific DNA-methyltransferase [Paraglaciecola chathamensis]MBJ2137915.1 site-specific DNA-methyltransferase [Paraglaciecola chathamensis]
MKKSVQNNSIQDDFLTISKSEIAENCLIKNISDTEHECHLFSGDNLSILEKLIASYEEKINFCYIDPPYNTGSNFIYGDTLKSRKDSIFGTHSKWMEFIKTRLLLSKVLLANDGIIAVSIDDYEQAYLKVVMDQVFGEENFIGTICVCRSNNGKRSRSSIATNHEYVLVYGKSSSSKVMGFKEVESSRYDKEDSHGKYTNDGLFRKKGDASRREDRPNMYFPLYYDILGNVYVEKHNDNLKEVYPVDSKGNEKRWLWGKDKAKRDSWKLYASKNGVIYVKNYFDSENRKYPKSLWIDNRYLTTKATNEIKEIYGDKIFETPKPIGLIEDLIECFCHKDGVILDFFAGTGTTAHAAKNLNHTRNYNLRTVLVEQSLTISENHIARINGFETTSDLTKKRLEVIKQRYHPSFSFSVFE